MSLPSSPGTQLRYDSGSEIESLLLRLSRHGAGDVPALLESAAPVLQASLLSVWTRPPNGDDDRLVMAARFGVDGAGEVEADPHVLAALATQGVVAGQHDGNADLQVPVWRQGVVAGLLRIERAAMLPWNAAERVAAVALADRIARMLGQEESTRAESDAGRREFLDLVQGLDAIVWEMDVPSFSFTFVSDRAEHILGYTPRRWIEEPTFWQDQLIHPDDRRWALDFCTSSTRQSRDHEFEYRAMHADGHIVWLRDFVRVVRDAGGAPLLLRGVMVDITREKQAEEALRASEESYRTIFQHSSEAMWVHDVETGEMLEVNRAGCDMYGYTSDEMMRRGHESLIYPGTSYTMERVSEYMGRAIAGESPRFEWLGRHKDGSETWGEVTLRRVTVNGKDRILATVRDIGERKKAEAALRRANEQLERRVAERTADLAAANRALEEEITERRTAERLLKESEEHFRRLIENGNDHIMIVDTTGAITYVGPSVERLLGYTPQEVIGTRPVDLCHPDDVPAVMAALEDIVLHPGEVRTNEFRIRHKDGSWRVFEHVGKTLSPHSAGEGVVANGRDVTERRRAEAALEHAKEEAERANRAKSDFLSRMSHELRTPLNSILGFAQVLDGMELPAREDRCVEHILRAGRHLLQLINEVLEISRIESGSQRLSLEPVRVGSVLHEAVSLARPMAAKAHVELEYETLRHENSYVWADRQRLSQVMLNLLSNAIKYNRAGGRVRLSCAELPGDDGRMGRLQVRVEDTGRGIAADRTGELFTPFARLGAEQGDVEGTGLGLALSQRLAEAMGGSLALERTSHEGSVFRVELELTQSQLEQVEDEARPMRSRGAVEHGSATLLYIEDNLANLSLVETILWERPKWRTLPALQGQIGIELAREHVPDLILLDLHLPDIRGEDVLHRLRADKRTATIPVVVVSADATPSVIDRLLGAGAAAFLTKPLNVPEFLETLDRLIPVHRTTDETAIAD